jgi:hypothetical protein
MSGTVATLDGVLLYSDAQWWARLSSQPAAEPSNLVEALGIFPAPVYRLPEATSAWPAWETLPAAVRQSMEVSSTPCFQAAGLFTQDFALAMRPSAATPGSWDMRFIPGPAAMRTWAFRRGLAVSQAAAAAASSSTEACLSSWQAALDAASGPFSDLTVSGGLLRLEDDAAVTVEDPAAEEAMLKLEWNPGNAFTVTCGDGSIVACADCDWLTGADPEETWTLPAELRALSYDDGAVVLDALPVTERLATSSMGNYESFLPLNSAYVLAEPPARNAGSLASNSAAAPLLQSRFLALTTTPGAAAQSRASAASTDGLLQPSDQHWAVHMGLQGQRTCVLAWSNTVYLQVRWVVTLTAAVEDARPLDLAVALEVLSAGPGLPLSTTTKANSAWATRVMDADLTKDGLRLSMAVPWDIGVLLQRAAGQPPAVAYPRAMDLTVTLQDLPAALAPYCSLSAWSDSDVHDAFHVPVHATEAHAVAAYTALGLPAAAAATLAVSPVPLNVFTDDTATAGTFGAVRPMAFLGIDMGIIDGGSLSLHDAVGLGVRWSPCVQWGSETQEALWHAAGLTAAERAEALDVSNLVTLTTASASTLTVTWVAPAAFNERLLRIIAALQAVLTGGPARTMSAVLCGLPNAIPAAVQRNTRASNPAAPTDAAIATVNGLPWSTCDIDAAWPQQNQCEGHFLAEAARDSDVWPQVFRGFLWIPPADDSSSSSSSSSGQVSAFMTATRGTKDALLLPLARGTDGLAAAARIGMGLQHPDEGIVEVAYGAAAGPGVLDLKAAWYSAGTPGSMWSSRVHALETDLRDFRELAPCYPGHGTLRQQRIAARPLSVVAGGHSQVQWWMPSTGADVATAREFLEQQPALPATTAAALTAGPLSTPQDVLCAVAARAAAGQLTSSTNAPGCDWSGVSSTNEYLTACDVAYVTLSVANLGNLGEDIALTDAVAIDAGAARHVVTLAWLTPTSEAVTEQGTLLAGLVTPGLSETLLRHGDDLVLMVPQATVALEISLGPRHNAPSILRVTWSDLTDASPGNGVVEVLDCAAGADWSDTAALTWTPPSPGTPASTVSLGTGALDFSGFVPTAAFLEAYMLLREVPLQVLCGTSIWSSTCMIETIDAMCSAPVIDGSSSSGACPNDLWSHAQAVESSTQLLSSSSSDLPSSDSGELSPYEAAILPAMEAALAEGPIPRLQWLGSAATMAAGAAACAVVDFRAQRRNRNRLPLRAATTWPPAPADDTPLIAGPSGQPLRVAFLPLTPSGGTYVCDRDITLFSFLEPPLPLATIRLRGTWAYDDDDDAWTLEAIAVTRVTVSPCLPISTNDVLSASGTAFDAASRTLVLDLTAAFQAAAEQLAGLPSRACAACANGAAWSTYCSTVAPASALALPEQPDAAAINTTAPDRGHWAWLVYIVSGCLFIAGALALWGWQALRAGR